MSFDKVRSTVELSYNEEIRDLRVTFDVIDRASAFVDWAAVAEKLQKGGRPLTDITKFIYFCLKEAGHNVEKIDDIYDELMMNPENEESYVMIFWQLVAAFSPQGKAKQKKPSKKKTIKAA